MSFLLGPTHTDGSIRPGPPISLSVLRFLDSVSDNFFLLLNFNIICLTIAITLVCLLVPGNILKEKKKETNKHPPTWQMHSLLALTVMKITKMLRTELAD